MGVQPYDEAGWGKIGDSAANLVARNPINPADYSTYDVDEWSVESWKAGTANAYNGIIYTLLITSYIGATMGQALPADYIDRGTIVAEKQLVIAGFRLAKTIEMIFNPNQTAEEVSVSFLK